MSTGQNGALTQRMFESGEPPALHADYQAAAYAALA